MAKKCVCSREVATACRALLRHELEVHRCHVSGEIIEIRDSHGASLAHTCEPLADVLAVHIAHEMVLMILP